MGTASSVAAKPVTTPTLTLSGFARRRSECVSICGDNIVADHEVCDDGSRINDDGCSVTCKQEPKLVNK